MSTPSPSLSPSTSPVPVPTASSSRGGVLPALLRTLSRSPTDSKSGSRSASPQADGAFVALHTTSSGESTAQSANHSPPTPTFDLPGPVYVPGSAASRLAQPPATAPGLPASAPSTPTSASSTSQARAASLQLARSALHRTSLPVRPRSAAPASAPAPAPARALNAAANTSPSPIPASLGQPIPFVSPPSPAVSTPAAMSALGRHLYETGLLRGALSDVHLLAFGRVYRLHSIVLAQSVFFANLLSGGFSEHRTGPRNASDANELIEINLAAPMTRAAFEFVVARMYGGGPVLVPPPWALATPTSPLSYAFERVWTRAAGKGVTGTYQDRGGCAAEDWSVLLAENVQPATPTFLIALLETASYLEVPSITAEAFRVLMTTLTPWTVTRYLSFALGHGLGPSVDPIELDSPCRGLESVGTLHRQARSRTSTNVSIESSSASSTSDESTLFVGQEGIRVGEAVALWLAKWGVDIFLVEEWLVAEGHLDDEPDLAHIPAHLATPDLRVWSSLPGGLSPAWVRAVISSDPCFFEPTVPRDVPTAFSHHQELARYAFAKRVVELRRTLATKERPHHDRSDLSESGASETGDEPECEGRKCSEDAARDEACYDDAENRELAELFSTGILYSHLSFEQLSLIRNDVSPSTGLPYVPQRVIAAAFFAAHDLRSRIPTTDPSALVSHSMYGSRDGAGAAAPPHSPEDTHLGLAVRVDPSLQASKLRDQARTFFLVPVDSTARINDCADPSSSSAGKKAPAVVSGPENFFGLALETRLGVDGRKPGVFGFPGEELSPRQFVPFEPFRISLQFWNVSALQDKQRIYSHSFFYLGSVYNVYLQRLNKRGLQLGVYLHRCDVLEPLPEPSRPPGFSSPSMLTGVLGATSAPPHQVTPVPYVDKRKAIQVFFSLWCPNQLGVSATRFSSGPDSFSISQSWGWKSSSLRSEEYLGCASPETFGLAGGAQEVGRFSSLRVTLVMGVV